MAMATASAAVHGPRGQEAAPALHTARAVQDNVAGPGVVMLTAAAAATRTAELPPESAIEPGRATVHSGAVL